MSKYDPERRRRYYEANREQENERSRRYGEANRERLREAGRRYRAANPDKVRGQQRRYYEANRERIADAARRRREAEPEKIRARQREANRRYYEANRAKLSEQQRKYRQANLEKLREQERKYREANRERLREVARERSRKYRAANPGMGMRQRHGPDIGFAFAVMWQAQEGRCYLCKKPLGADDTAIDHDHSCCPPERSCSYCRRGLTHQRCNSLIGLAGDDPTFLRMVADNLEPILNLVRARIARTPQQGVLGEES